MIPLDLTLVFTFLTSLLIFDALLPAPTLVIIIRHFFVRIKLAFLIILFR